MADSSCVYGYACVHCCCAYANFQDIMVASSETTQLNLSAVRGLHLCLASLAVCINHVCVCSVSCI